MDITRVADEVISCFAHLEVKVLSGVVFSGRLIWLGGVEAADAIESNVSIVTTSFQHP